ncbi:hypothetical protein BX616_004934 [Lobosporangium transversale]|nr:hypothetical protein BX616_004934 [Lobosporangium transversale]
MTATSVPDNQMILQRAAETCRDLDDLRYQLHSIQKRLVKARQLPRNNPPQPKPSLPLQPAVRDDVLMALLNEAYTLQFQISTLLAATEEPIPERQRISKPKGQQQAKKSTMTSTNSNHNESLPISGAIGSTEFTYQHQTAQS